MPIPFNKGYVLRITAKHMRRSIDISIRKTFERVQEFEPNTQEQREIFETLSVLHNLRKQLDDFQESNSSTFRS